MCSVVYHKLRSVYGSICCTLLVDGGLAVCYRSVAVGNAYVSAEVEHVVNVLALFACRSHCRFDSVLVEQGVGCDLLDVRLVAARVANVEVQFAALVGLKAHHGDVVLERCKYRALIAHTVHVIVHVARSCVHVEIAHVSFCIGGTIRLCRLVIVVALAWESK